MCFSLESTKSFRWLLENDVGYTIFLTKKVEEEERAGPFKPEGPKKLF